VGKAAYGGADRTCQSLRLKGLVAVRYRPRAIQQQVSLPYVEEKMSVAVVMGLQAEQESWRRGCFFFLSIIEMAFDGIRSAVHGPILMAWISVIGVKYLGRQRTIQRNEQGGFGVGDSEGRLSIGR
jgi:hypothetical protein